MTIDNSMLRLKCEWLLPRISESFYTYQCDQDRENNPQRERKSDRQAEHDTSILPTYSHLANRDRAAPSSVISTF
ncbi:MAG: hypothetical protein K0R47_5579 [Brevibacillus sp.]|nr:hypothetical protein [Brevibacillus sp.]